MPDIPEDAVKVAAEAIGYHMILRESPEQIARAALEAVAPILAESVAQKILAHAERQFPETDPAKVPGKPDVWRAWHRHFGIAARIAAGAFYTDEDKKRLAAEAIARGDFISCAIPETPREPREDEDDA